MSEALDTSVVLRLLTGEPPEQADVARRYVGQRAEPIRVDALVIGESYFALRHHYHVPHREAVGALHAFVCSDRVRVSSEVIDALKTARAEREPGLLDRLIVAAARDAACVLRTFDRRLARLDGALLLR